MIIYNLIFLDPLSYRPGLSAGFFIDFRFPVNIFYPGILSSSKPGTGNPNTIFMKKLETEFTVGDGVLLQFNTSMQSLRAEVDGLFYCGTGGEGCIHVLKYNLLVWTEWDERSQRWRKTSVEKIDPIFIKPLNYSL